MKRLNPSGKEEKTVDKKRDGSRRKRIGIEGGASMRSIFDF